jgi:multidrug resistance efflux pump
MENVHPLLAPLLGSMRHQAQTLGEVGALKQTIRKMKAALQQADEALDRYADVKDGSHGEPEANDAMAAQMEIRQAIMAADAALKG